MMHVLFENGEVGLAGRHHIVLYYQTTVLLNSNLLNNAS